MANDFTIDPFTQIYDGIWTLLEAQSIFTNLVKAGNRIKYSGDREFPSKPTAQHADLPEAELIPAEGVEEISFSSSHVRLQRDYHLILKTNSTRLNHKLFPLEWACLKILYSGADTLNLSFIKAFRLIGSDPNIYDQVISRGRPGWFSVLTINVQAVIPITDLAL